MNSLSVSRGSRRGFIHQCAVAGLSALVAHHPAVEAADRTDLACRIRGLLIGGVLGDALGGPVEFQEGPLIDAALPGTRQWAEDRRLTAAELKTLAETLPLYSYESLRPGIESYGQWYERSPAGTTTDDTRHKIVLMRTLKHAVDNNSFPVTARSLATQYLHFTPKQGEEVPESLKPLLEDAFLEYRTAARWLLGERDPKRALPLERLWAGEPNCSGQMMLTPLAAAFPGDPEAAYIAAFSLDFIDGPGARDMAAALVAGLSAVLSPGLDAAPVSQRWEAMFMAMEKTDPYRYADVTFTGRPLHYWLKQAKHFAQIADGRPARLFELLETEGRPIYWWDAHFTLLVPLTILVFCQYDPLAALHLTLDFRHDTDSYAHVLGAMVGAVHGEEIFKPAFRQTVADRHSADYGESFVEWERIVRACADRHQNGNPVVLPIGADE